jgi:hypothetical protein
LSNPIDLSKAKKTKHITFSVSENPRWIIPTLRTLTPAHKNFQQISLDVSLISFHRLEVENMDAMDSAGFKDAIGEAVCRGYLELDLLLAQLWESHSIHPEVTFAVQQWVDLTRARSLVESLLPEVSKRGIVDLIGKHHRRTKSAPRIRMVFDKFLHEEWGGGVV